MRARGCVTTATHHRVRYLQGEGAELLGSGHFVKYQSGDSVELRWTRGGAASTTTVTLAAR